MRKIELKQQCRTSIVVRLNAFGGPLRPRSKRDRTSNHVQFAAKYGSFAMAALKPHTAITSLNRAGQTALANRQADSCTAGNGVTGRFLKLSDALANGAWRERKRIGRFLHLPRTRSTGSPTLGRSWMVPPGRLVAKQSIPLRLGLLVTGMVLPLTVFA